MYVNNCLGQDEESWTSAGSPQPAEAAGTGRRCPGAAADTSAARPDGPAADSAAPAAHHTAGVCTRNALAKALSCPRRHRSIIYNIVVNIILIFYDNIVVNIILIIFYNNIVVHYGSFN